MSKHAREFKTNPSAQSRRFQIMSVAALVIIFAIAATAISMQASKGDEPNEETTTSSAPVNSRSQSLPMRSSQDGQQLTQAQIRPLTQAEAQQIAEGLKALVNQSTEGLKQVHHADGTVSMDLDGRFQSVALAKKTENGNVAQSCVDNPESAAAFLGINRELIDGVKSTPAKTRQSHQIESGTPGKGQKR
ncbi:MAG TPA: hypothetical protein VNO50_08705 [Pyrinomonadaceae bacterium]|nr:hypothetical protein [Pyrinomonadaceae bacterium]